MADKKKKETKNEPKAEKKSVFRKVIIKLSGKDSEAEERAAAEKIKAEKKKKQENEKNLLYISQTDEIAKNIYRVMLENKMRENLADRPFDNVALAFDKEAIYRIEKIKSSYAFQMLVRNRSEAELVSMVSAPEKTYESFLMEIRREKEFAVNNDGIDVASFEEKVIDLEAPAPAAAEGEDAFDSDEEAENEAIDIGAGEPQTEENLSAAPAAADMQPAAPGRVAPEEKNFTLG